MRPLATRDEPTGNATPPYILTLPEGPAPLPDGAGPPAPAARHQIAAVGRGHKLSSALFWSYAVTTGGYAITALLTFVLAAILDPRQFGVLAIAMIWITLVQALLQHGPTMAVIQQEDITDDHVNAAFWSTMGGALLFAILVAATAPLWAAVNRLPELVPVSLGLTPIVLLQASSVIPEAVLRRRMQMRGIALRYLTSGLTGGVAGIACAIAGLGVWALVVQQVTSYALNTVMLWSVTPWRPRLRPIGKQLRDIRRTSLQTLAGAVGNFAASRSDVLLMGAFFGPVVVGLYRFAARFAEMVVDLTARGLQQVSLPHLAGHGDDPQRLAERLRRLTHAAGVLAFPALGILAAVAHPLVLVIGDQWARAAMPLRVMCLVSAIGIINSLLGPALQAAQRPGLPAALAWITAAFTGTAIVFSARLSAGFGDVGRLLAVAFAALAGQVVLLVAQSYLTFRRVLRVSAWPTVAAGLPGLLAGLAALATTPLMHPVGPHNPVLRFGVCACVAGTAAAVVLLGLDGEVRSWLGHLRRRLRRGATVAAAAPQES